MRGSSKIFVFAGVGLGLVAVLLIVSSMGGGGKAQENNKSGKVTVVQAVNDVPAHTILNPEDLVTKEVSSDQAPADAVRSLTEAVGKSYRVPLLATQTLVVSQVEQPGLRNDVAVGKRALALPVDEKNLFAGLIQDGDYIDVIFDARINEVRLIDTNIADTPEDEPYYNFGKQKGQTQNEDQDQESDEQSNGVGTTTTGSPVAWVPPGLEVPQHPAVGDANSQLFIRDDIAEQQQLEPVAKVMVQDVRVLRVVRPGEKYGPAGEILDEAENAANTSGMQEQSGYVVVEVDLQQAEALAFMHDKRHELQLVVRGEGDHEIVETTGVTFEIMYQSGSYKLPLPGSVTVSGKKK